MPENPLTWSEFLFVILPTLLVFAVHWIVMRRSKCRSFRAIWLTSAALLLLIAGIASPFREPILLLAAAVGMVLAICTLTWKGRIVALFPCALLFVNAISFEIPIAKRCGYNETSRSILGALNFAEKDAKIAVFGDDILPLKWYWRERGNAEFFEDELLRDDFSIVVAPWQQFEKWEQIVPEKFAKYECANSFYFRSKRYFEVYALKDDACGNASEKISHKGHEEHKENFDVRR